MVEFCAVFLLFLRVIEVYSVDVKDINQLVKQWAPLIWLSPNEQYFPLSVDTFLENVHLQSESGVQAGALQDNDFLKIDAQSLFLVANKKFDSTKAGNLSFVHGENPKENPVPVYALITPCNPHRSFHLSNLDTIQEDINFLSRQVEPDLFFHVTYWSFFPYNKGKDICFLGKVPSLSIFGRCFGKPKLMGNHLGDWERMTLSFKGRAAPSEMYLATHNIGGYYKFDQRQQIFRYDIQRARKQMTVQMTKFPPIVRLQGGHPVVFAADGSHGLWAAPGAHQYNFIPRLIDKCDYGVPWKTWNHLQVINVADHGRLPHWIGYKGRWGNPKKNCVLSRKLGLCEYTDGPLGPLRNNRDFYCG